jgi:hypothetical protein
MANMFYAYLYGLELISLWSRDNAELHMFLDFWDSTVGAHGCTDLQKIKNQAKKLNGS